MEYVQREEHFNSLYWLLEEPLIYGAHFDLTNDDCNIPGIPGLTEKQKYFGYQNMYNGESSSFVGSRL